MYAAEMQDSVLHAACRKGRTKEVDGMLTYAGVCSRMLTYAAACGLPKRTHQGS